MVNKKVYISLLIILAVFFIGMFLLFGLDNIRQERYDTTIIVGDNTVWKYEKKRWTNVTYKSSLQELNWNKFKVFSNNEEIGTYYLWHDDKWYAFDDEKNAVPIDDAFIAYKANFNLKVRGFNQEEVEDLSYINYVLEENDLGTSSEFSSLYKFNFDIDNDSIQEEFYLMTNAFLLDFNPEKTFGIAFMVKNNSIYYIYNDISTNKYFKGCKPYYNTFLDINNDGIYEFVLSCAKYSTASQTDMLYQFSDDSFKILISNQ